MMTGQLRASAAFLLVEEHVEHSGIFIMGSVNFSVLCELTLISVMSVIRPYVINFFRVEGYTSLERQAFVGAFSAGKGLIGSDNFNHKKC
jgi:hypothetical protein